MKKFKLTTTDLPDGIYRTENRGFGCRFCLIYYLNNKTALTHDCDKSRARISKIATDPGERNGGFYLQIKGRHV